MESLKFGSHRVEACSSSVVQMRFNGPAQVTKFHRLVTRSSLSKYLNVAVNDSDDADVILLHPATVLAILANLLVHVAIFDILPSDGLDECECTGV